MLKKIIFFFLTVQLSVFSQVLNHKKEFTKQDSLRGTNNEFRKWWNVLQYNISITPNYEEKSIKGSNNIKLEMLFKPKQTIFQIDLQEPMQIDAVTFNNKKIKKFTREGNVYFIPIDEKFYKKEGKATLKIDFSGNPKIAKNAPWDGGWIFTTDEKNRPWMSVACQGLGASVWYPNKDYLGDEPENGANISIQVPKNLVAVANGNLLKIAKNKNSNTYTWSVKNPINNYNIVPYIGYYESFNENYNGKKGKLDLNYWVLDYNLTKAKKQFKQVKPMLNCFEDWFGPYPFYEDGFKLIESPYLGMEHQSGIAYGNHYVNGYLGSDLSGTGWGLKWDFIIVHESGHEWFGNNITNNDVADMWIHESFTAYSEALFVECEYGLQAANEYVIGTRRSISNDIPIIGIYGVNQEGSGDMYYKGANIIHTLRQLINDDDLFRDMLLELNQQFYHSTVNSIDIENYISKKTKIDLKEFFNQYLRTTQIPNLQYFINNNKITYRYTNTIANFNMPIRILNASKWLVPTEKWKTESLDESLLKNFSIDDNFYITTQKIENPIQGN